MKETITDRVFNVGEYVPGVFDELWGSPVGLDLMQSPTKKTKTILASMGHHSTFAKFGTLVQADTVHRFEFCSLE